MADYVRRVSLSEILRQAGPRIRFVSNEDLACSDDLCLPSFLLHPPKQHEGHLYSDPPQAFRPNPLSSLPFFAQMACYSGDEIDLQAAVAAILISTPGCLLRRQPNVDFLQPFRNPSPGLTADFALVMDSISRSVDWKSQPSERWFQSDLTHPILLLGIRRDLSQSIGTALRDLASLVEPHLHAHIVNWHLRSEQTATSKSPDSETGAPPTLPPWLVMFGLLYRGGPGEGSITIVAHIPYMANAGEEPSARRIFSYLALVVDHISLPGLAHQPQPSVVSPDNDDDSPVICNIRAALALLSLKQHAVRLANAWEGVQWPQFVYEIYSDIEREHLGSLGSPSECERDVVGLLELDEESLTESEQDAELKEEEYAQMVAEKKSVEMVNLWSKKVDLKVKPPSG